MSIINNAHPGSQIRLVCLVDRVLNRRQKQKPISRQELIETCRPENLPRSDGAKKRFVGNLDFWVEEGLWEKGENGVASKDSRATEQNLPVRVLKRCIAQCDSQGILEGNRLEPLLRTISVLLAQDQLTFQGQQRGTQRLDKPGDIAEAINSRFALSINESNEANTLKDWGIFLGFLEPFAGGMIVDPTQAVEPLLANIFIEKHRLPIRDFIAALADRLPMLDGGVYRQVVEPLLEEKGWQRPLENRVSASLSHALLRLEKGLQLILEQPADDSRSMTLKTTDGGDRSVGMVRYRENG